MGTTLATMLTWIAGVLRAPCTLTARYSIGLLGGRPESTTLAAGYNVGVLGGHPDWDLSPSTLKLISVMTNIAYLFNELTCF